MKTKIGEFEVLIPNSDGTTIAERVTVPVPLEWDEEVKQWLLTPEAHQIIEDTKARRIGLLLPAQLKELRERCDYTQKEMGELFQVGEKSWTRWESGKHRPSRSINLLIRALYEKELSINYLLKRAGKPLREESARSPYAEIAQVWASCLEGATDSEAPYCSKSTAILIKASIPTANKPVGDWGLILSQRSAYPSSSFSVSAQETQDLPAEPRPRFDTSKLTPQFPRAS